jgi:L-asparaginase II
MTKPPAPKARAADPVLAEVLRGARVESIHRGAVAVVRGDELVYAAGDVDAPQFWRSAAKPFQATAALAVLRDEGFAVRPVEAALIAASHGGAPLQTDAVRELLARGGVDPSALRCGAHAPYDVEAAAALVRKGEAPSPLHHNCSGKHAGMLISAKLRGLPLDGYLEPGHPVQVAARAEVAAAAEVAPMDVGVEVDGCGAPTFVLSTLRAAKAYARFGASTRPLDVDLRAAVAAEHAAYAGPGKTCARVIVATGGRVYPKAGAEGFYAAAIPDLKIGLAYKFADGSHRATPAFLATLLLKVVADWSPSARAALSNMATRKITNAAGIEVGSIRVVLP